MRKFEKYIFIYSAIAVTVFFLTSAFLSPTPQNFISGILILPIFLYFWLKLTSAQEVDLSKWSIRLLIIIVLISALAVYTYFLSLTKDKADKTEFENELSARSDELTQKSSELDDCKENAEKCFQELDQTKEELIKVKLEQEITDSNIKSESLSGVLSEADEEIQGNIRVVPSIQSIVYVYEDAVIASEKIGELKKESEYPFTERAGNWYKIIFDNSLPGWVSANNVEAVK